MSEKLLVNHCSPTLAGMKTANMFTSPYKDRESMARELGMWNRTIGKKGVRVMPLKYDDGRALVYVCRPARLERDLLREDNRMLLFALGYPLSDVWGYIAKLRERLNAEGEFPHEIGLFLGYPARDVYGFIANRAENCSFSGCWKVYGNEEEAKKLFEKYKKCTDIYMEQLKKGRSLEKLTVAEPPNCGIRRS